MKRSTRFLIGLVAAALTYGSLTALVGPRHFGGRGGYPYQAYGGERQDRCREMNRNHWRNPAGAPREGQTGNPAAAHPIPEAGGEWYADHYDGYEPT